ncbi:MAG: hypothetical protein P8099_20750 [Gemmatimonadota bacterium]
MARYVVMDVHWVDQDAVTLGDHAGKEIDRFHTLECARALTLQRLANGNLGTIVVDVVTGDCVYPPPQEADDDGDALPASGTREKGEAAEPPRGSRVKSSA